jgi:hypothetical protein
MTNFNYKKYLTENKLTQTTKLRAGILAEGQFSWMTQDTGQQIGSQEENMIPVYMYDDKGNVWKESNYDGYGDFGGMDYYELLDKMNGGEGDRSRGIDLSFDKVKTDNEILYPALVTRSNFDWRSHDFTKEAKRDPNQSWYMEPEEEDYNGEDYVDYNNAEDDMMEGLNEAKMYYHVLEDGGYGRIGYQGYYNTPEEAKKRADTLSDMFPKSEFYVEAYPSKKEPVTVTMEGKKKYYNNAEADDAEHIKALEKDMKDDKKSSKMKKSKLKNKIKEMILNELNLNIDNMDNAPESEVDFLAEVDAVLKENSPINDPRTEQIIQMLKDMEVDGETMEYILRQVGIEDQMANQLVNYPTEYADSLKEGVWSVVPSLIPNFIKAVEDIKEEYHGIVGSDDVYDGLDRAIIAAEELMNINEDKKRKKEVVIDDTKISTDTPESDIEITDTDTSSNVDPNVKAVQDALTQAQAAAQQLGDPKLTDQIGNTITFFTRTHIVNQDNFNGGINESIFPMLKRILK